MNNGKKLRSPQATQGGTIEGSSAKDALQADEATEDAQAKGSIR